MAEQMEEGKFHAVRKTAYAGEGTDTTVEDFYSYGNWLQTVSKQRHDFRHKYMANQLTVYMVGSVAGSAVSSADSRFRFQPYYDVLLFCPVNEDFALHTRMDRCLLLTVGSPVARDPLRCSDSRSSTDDAM